MNDKRSIVAAAAAMVMVAALGCGGGKSNSDATAGGEVSLHEQFRLAMADSSPQSRAERLVSVGLKQHRAGDNSGAATSFREAEKAIGEIEDPYFRATSKASWAGASARSGNKTAAGKSLKDAASIAEQISSVENKVAALCRIAEVYAVDLQEPGNATAKLKDAEKLTQEISNVSYRLGAISTLIRGYEKTNKSADVDRLIGQAGELASNISDPQEKAEALANLGRAIVDADRPEEGIARLSDATTAARQIEKKYNKAYALTTIAGHYADARSAEEAQSLLVEVETLTAEIPEIDLRKEIEDRSNKVSAAIKKSKQN